MDSEERKLWKRYERSRAAKTRIKLRNLLVELHLPIAARVAGKYSLTTPRAVEYDDIYSAGYQGLIDAIPRFRLARGTEASTFLQFRVTGAICDYLRSCDSMRRLDRTRLKRVQQWEQEELCRTATHDEIDEHFGFRLLQPNVISINRPIDGHSEKTLSETLSDGAAETSRGYGELSYLLRGLSQRDRLIVVLYHVEGIPMKQVAETLGISESRVSQLMKDLLDRVRRNASAA